MKIVSRILITVILVVHVLLLMTTGEAILSGGEAVILAAISILND